jgi:hypothetical protein
VQPSSRPMPLPKAAQEPTSAGNTNTKDARGLTLDNYLGRQRIMGLMIVKDAVV